MTTLRHQPTGSWDTVRPARRGQWLLVALGVLALPPGLLAAGLRLFPPRADGPALLASFIPYGILGWLLATLFFVVAALRSRRQRVVLILLSAIAVLGLAYQTAAQVPFFVPDGRTAVAPSFTVLSLNMKHGYADPVELAAAAQSADLVVLVEATPLAIDRLDQRGIRQRFPYESGSTADGTNGSVVYSRFPLRDGAALPSSSFQQWAVTVDLPQLGELRLLAVHPCNPFCGGNAWAREHDDLRRVALSADDGPLVLAGDFNAIDDHGPMMQLRRDGLRSATDVAGAGWLPTWPANSSIPPMIPIDHVMVNQQLTATAVSTVRISGTDHLALRAVLAATG